MVTEQESGSVLLLCGARHIRRKDSVTHHVAVGKTLSIGLTTVSR